MDHSVQTQDQPYQFWSLPFQEDVNLASDPRDRLSPLQTQFIATYGSVLQSPDTFFTLDELDSYPSSRNSARHRTASSMIDWTSSDNVQFPIPDTSSSTRRKTGPEKPALSPAQSRRRSQNGTAQRAFRERKAWHIKDLEAKIATLEEVSKAVGGENERLKQEITGLNNKNLTLRATDDLDDLDNYVKYASWQSKQQQV